MLNRKPIFINAFSRGGSNILWNIFLTHPDVCSPIIETLDIFRIGRYGRWSGYQAIWHTGQVYFFDQKKLTPRKPISERAKAYIDQTLYSWKLKTMTDEEMHYKYEGELYALEEIKEARLVAKNNNGLTFLSNVFFDMYPDATFVSLVRNPLALYEGYKRRQFVQSLSEFTEFYTSIADRMLADSECYERYHIIRFEDLLTDLKTSVTKLYDWADLDLNKIQKMRFKAKNHSTANGSWQNRYAFGQHHWVTFEEANAFLEDDVNRFQIERLETVEKQSILDQLGTVMERLGYSRESK
jgi:hypothetical protein